MSLQSQPSQPIPPRQFPALDSSGLFRTPWFLYLSQFATQPGPLTAIAVGASPFAFTASGPGSLAISGGTVSSVTLTRGGVTIPTGITAGSIAMANNDVATITYAVAPTLNFIPG